jgi:malate dehydrogenase (oxaloacetate-decarboxylating)(NADP+)
MLLAAKSLAEQVTDDDLAMGTLYPPLEKIRTVSAKIAESVALNAHKTGVATKPRPTDMLVHVKSLMYDPFADPFS